MSAGSVLIISHDVVDVCMAGPGIRYWELAHVLAREFEVVLAVPRATSLTTDLFRLVVYPPDEPEQLAPLVRDADAVLAYGYAACQWPFLGQAGVPWIADVYVPEPTEALGWFAGEPLARRQQHYEGMLLSLQPLARGADFYLCANDRQRDFWLGILAAHGRLTPAAYDQDPTLRRLIDVVPSGLAPIPPTRSKPVLKGVWPGVGVDDQVVLWGGGLWDWLDPLSLIRAMVQVLRERPKTRLVFLGSRHPNADEVPEMAMLGRVQNLVRDLHLQDRVFLGEWVPYAERGAYLLEADVGVVLHLDTVETHFAHRTRLLDCFWAGLPMVVSRGDEMSEKVAAFGLGHVVEPGDEAQTVQALLALLSEPKPRESRASGFELVRSQLLWEQVAKPLVQFCREPHRDETKAQPEAWSARETDLSRRLALQACQIEELSQQVAAYRRGRFMRFMAWVADTRRRVWLRGSRE